MSLCAASLTGLTVPSGSSALGFAGLSPRRAAGDASPMEQVRRENQQSFASLLSQSVAARSGTKATSEMTEAEQAAQARTAAEEFVAVAFVQPIFKNLRNSSMGADLPPPLGPGPGEKQFRSLADTQVAKQLVRASNWPLVDSIAKKLLSGKGGGAAPNSAEAFAKAPVLPGSPADLRERKEQQDAETAAKLAATSQEAVK